MTDQRVPALDPAPPPRPVGPSAWHLPDPTPGEEVVGVGADLRPSTLVDAYRRAIFPWPQERGPVPWCSPERRGVLPAGTAHVSRSLRRTLTRCGWHTTLDVAFAEVVAECARRRAGGTWITAQMRDAYTALARLGWAHSLEVWSGAELVGGIYGVQLGGVFTGESMFHRRDDASKVALVDLDARLAAAGGALLDVQLVTPHLRSLGAVEVPRDWFLRELAAERDRPVRLDRAALPVERLVVRDAASYPVVTRQVESGCADEPADASASAPDDDRGDS